MRIRLGAAIFLLTVAMAAAAPEGLILDTDIGNDADDVLTLGVMYALQTEGECRQLAVTITNDHPLTAALADAINTFYRRGDVPIGVVRGGVMPDPGRFAAPANQRDGDVLRNPHDLRSGTEAPKATRLLRQILAAQPDGSVAIAQIDFSSNLARRLDMKGEDISPLSGIDLIRAKARLLPIMAGAFPPIRGRPHLEYNVIQDNIPAAMKVVRE